MPKPTIRQSLKKANKLYKVYAIKRAVNNALLQVKSGIQTEEYSCREVYNERNASPLLRQLLMRRRDLEKLNFDIKLKIKQMKEADFDDAITTNSI